MAKKSDWIYNQSSFRWDYGVGLSVTVSGGTEKILTTYKEGSQCLLI